jgi:hypothetical protein
MGDKAETTSYWVIDSNTSVHLDGLRVGAKKASGPEGKKAPAAIGRKDLRVYSVDCCIQ